mmetsp:Transcript_112106/g.317508  ORF Transcript_112106/g.317508 Transcript_112106/m.317508 type:complete len:244 (-) Transcript_112106:351-1082(-)
MCRLITGMPSSSSTWRKKGIVDHAFGSIRLKTSTGTAETYSSAVTTEPSLILRPWMEPSSAVRISWMGALVRTSPPLASTYLFIGSQTRSGWFPSRKAICRPSSSLRKRFIAVRTTVIESLSGSMKSRALAIEMKTSSLMRSGMPYLRMNSVTDSSSCASMKSWPSISIGSSGGAVWSFSCRVSIFWLSRMARAKLKGAGMPGTKSNVVNSPGSSCIAKIILWTFHWSLSCRPSSEKRFIMFG